VAQTVGLPLRPTVVLSVRDEPAIELRMAKFDIASGSVSLGIVTMVPVTGSNPNPRTAGETFKTVIDRARGTTTVRTSVAVAGQAAPAPSRQSQGKRGTLVV